VTNLRPTIGELYRSADPRPALLASDRMTTVQPPGWALDQQGDWDEYRRPEAVVVFLSEQSAGDPEVGGAEPNPELVWTFATADKRGYEIQIIGRDPRPVDAFRDALALAFSLGRMTGSGPLPVLWIGDGGDVHDLCDTAEEAMR
jgi:hypothetical protein